MCFNEIIKAIKGLLSEMGEDPIDVEDPNLPPDDDIEDPDETEDEEESEWADLKPLDPDSCRLVKVDWSKYYKVQHPKRQIVLHHTVSGPGIEGDLAHWKNFNSHIATCVIIDRDGPINKLFNWKYWGFHLGAGNRTLDQQSIAIELDSWGPLILGDGKQQVINNRTINTVDGQFYNVYGGKVNVPYVYYPEGFRGYKYYEAYGHEQIRSVGKLLLFLCDKFDIPLTYNEDMWDVSQDSLNGKKGIWSHTSYRAPSEKQDCHPDPQLISMLKELETIYNKK